MAQGSDFEIRRQLLQMEMLYEIGLAVSESLDPTYVAQEILDRALVMVDARSGMLLVRDQEEATHDIIAQVGLDHHAEEILQLQEVEKVWNERRLVQKEREDSACCHLCIVALESQQQVNGLLIVADKEYRDGTVGSFNENDETLLRSFAYQAGSALHNARLHRRLEEAYEQLRQSQKMEALGQLAGGVAHDFNNLLTIIAGYSELGLIKLDADHPLRPNLDEIRQAGERAASLTRQLLAFSRQQVLQPEVLDLNQVFANMSKMLGRLISESIELIFTPDPSLGQIRADPGQIEQVIINLAVNARDAMPRGGSLTVETRNVELDEGYAQQHEEVRPGAYVRVSVSDTGQGMDARTQARIFEPFFTTKAPGEGTGLGLSMIHTIVKQSEGHVAVYSEVGIGTTFHIYLPQLDGEGQVVAARPGRVEVPRGRETILLVEDEESLRHLAQTILENHGYAVLAKATSEAALSLFEQHLDGIDLLLTDVVMPGMDGKELADRLEVLRPRLKVLYMSGYPDNVLAQHGILPPDVALLQKPFSPETIVRKVREVLDG